MRFALFLIVILGVSLGASSAHAELRAFRLKIVDSSTGTERFVTTRLDHIQYPMYNHLRQTEVVSIDRTWMCYDRSDYAGALCTAPAESPANQTTSAR